MPTDPDQRIRRAVIEVVDTAPAPPAFDELTAPLPPHRPVRRILTIAIAAITVVALAIGTALFVRDERSTPARSAGSGSIRIPLTRIPIGVSARSMRGVPVYVIRRGEDVTTYGARFEAVGAQRQVWWCRDERLFLIPSQRLLFDRGGRPIDGASSGLDRFDTRVRDDQVDVNLGVVTADRVESSRRAPARFENWYLGSPAFCSRPLVSGGYKDPTSAADAHVAIKALPTLKYDMSEITIPAGIVQILFTSAGGTHTLVFDEAKLGGFQLAAPRGPALGDVELHPGVYTFFCSIPGHRGAGEEGTLVVTPH